MNMNKFQKLLLLMKSNYCGTTPEMQVFNRSAGTLTVQSYFKILFCRSIQSSCIQETFLEVRAERKLSYLGKVLRGPVTNKNHASVPNENKFIQEKYLGLRYPANENNFLGKVFKAPAPNENIFIQENYLVLWYHKQGEDPIISITVFL